MVSWHGTWGTDRRCPACETCPQLVAAVRAGGPYEGVLRRIVQAFKYDGRTSLRAPLARLMRTAGADLLAEVGTVVPVPLHPCRQWQRGFNQATLLAARLQWPVLHAVWRTRVTQSQAQLTGPQRRRNVWGAFRLSPLLGTRRIRASLIGYTVMLVDDVRTTGATLDACAAVLLDAGAARVVALTAACAHRQCRDSDAGSRPTAVGGRAAA